MEAAAVPEVAVSPDNAGPIIVSTKPAPRTTFTVRPGRTPNILQLKPISLNELHKASVRGDHVHALSLLKPTKQPVYKVNERVPSDSPVLAGYTPLLLAAAIDRDVVVRLLLIHGADPQARTPEGVSALHLAVESRHMEPPDYIPQGMIRVADPKVAEPQRHWTIRLLLIAGLDINVRDEWDFTPLHRACNVDNRQSLILLLINSGADVNARSITGATPLHVAAELDRCMIARLLIRCGSEVNAVTNEHRLTPLHLAVVHHHQDMIKLLLKRGADIEAKTSHGYMAIHLAALSNNRDPLTYLLRRGAPMDIPAGENDQTPLHMSCMRGNDAAMKYLLRAGANVHARCKKGMTPLHTLIMANHERWKPYKDAYRMVDYLMRSGGDINIRDADGRTALHIACSVDSKKTTPYLLDWNADMFAKDKYNRTPLDYCSPESLNQFRAIFCPYIEKLRSLLQRPIGGDTWPQINTDHCESVKYDLHAMACYKLAGSGFTLMDLMLKSAREMSCRLTAKQLHTLDRLIFVEGKRHFPIYYVLIGQKIQAINDELKKKELMRPAKKALNKIMGWQMPDDCISKLFEYLHASDVNNLISATEHRFIVFAKDLVRRGPSDSSRSRGTTRSDAPKIRFSWSNIDNNFDSIYSPYPSCW